MTLFADTGAEFSPCGQYRYRLWRRWGDGPTALWLMLNPSTADDAVNDATVERCQRRAQLAGYGRLLVANIFALRSTDPAALYAHPDPVGPDNDRAIARMVREADLIICGWGNHGAHLERGQQVMASLRKFGHELHALKMTGQDQPGHPLYIGYNVRPRPIAELIRAAA